MIAVMDADESWECTRPELMQRAVHLAALRILVDQRRTELEGVVEAADSLACSGYVIGHDDVPARLEFGRRTRQLARRAKAAEYELRAAEGALRAAVLDDAWTPSDDIDGSPTD
jgi:2-keto-4-pentenoate hydratase